jgi:hypothetical protein
METDRGTQVPGDDEGRPLHRLRVVAFPFYDPAERYPGELAELAVLARMLRSTVSDLIEARANDYIPWAELPPSRHAQEPAELNEERVMGDEKTSEKVLASGWDDVDKAAASSGAWLKWTPGQVHTVNVFGQPEFVEKVFDDDPKPKRRVRVDVYVPGDGVKNWEMSPSVYKDLAEERASCKAPFGEAVFLVKRVGEGMKTIYKMRYERQLTAAELADRNDTGAPSGKDAGDIPF